jgi:hypothetical protein
MPSMSRARIRTPDQRLRAFVSSTLGELAEERQAVSRAVAALGTTPSCSSWGRGRTPRASSTKA